MGNAARSLLATVEIGTSIKVNDVKPSDWFAQSQSLGSAAVKEGAPELLELYERKRNYCGCLPDGSMQMLDRMVSQHPEKRPTPRELLESPLFRNMSMTEGNVCSSTVGHHGH